MTNFEVTPVLAMKKLKITPVNMMALSNLRVVAEGKSDVNSMWMSAISKAANIRDQ